MKQNSICKYKNARVKASKNMLSFGVNRIDVKFPIQLQEYQLINYEQKQNFLLLNILEQAELRQKALAYIYLSVFCKNRGWTTWLGDGYSSLSSNWFKVSLKLHLAAMKVLLDTLERWTS